MLAFLAVSRQLCVDGHGFVVFGEKRRQQGMCSDVVPASEDAFSVHIFADSEEVAELKSVVPSDVVVKIYTKSNISMSNGVAGQQLTLVATNAFDDMARHLRANQAMNRVGMNWTTYQIDAYSVQAKLQKEAIRIGAVVGNYQDYDLLDQKYHGEDAVTVLYAGTRNFSCYDQ